MSLSKKKVLTSSLFLLFHFYIVSEGVEFRIDNSDLEINSKGKKIKFISESSNSSGLSSETLFFNNISVIISDTEGYDKLIKSDKAQYKPKKNVIHLQGNVFLEIKNKHQPFKLRTQILTLNIDSNLVQTNSRVTIENEEIEINADNAVINDIDKEKRVTLNKAKIFSQKRKIGESNKLIFNLFDPVILLIGSAQITSEDYTINASEISYNLKKDKINYSKNSSITTSN